MSSNLMAYTQGKWTYRMAVCSPEHHSFYIELEDKNNPKSFIGEIGGGLQSNDEIEKNAKLVSAAPDLLEALIVCWRSLQTYGSHPIIEKQVELALGKATQ